MATQVWRNNPGESADAVTTAVGAATTKLVEVTVDLGAMAAAGIPRSQWQTQIFDALTRIQDAMTKNIPTVF